MKLRMALRMAARHSRRDGTITEEQFQTVMDAIRNPVRKGKDGVTRNLMECLDEHIAKEMGRTGISINWDAIIQWIKDHWLQIISTILTFIIL